MYHAACKVEFQPFTRSYSQLTFFNFLLKKKLFIKILVQRRIFLAGLALRAELRGRTRKSVTCAIVAHAPSLLWLC